MAKTATTKTNHGSASTGLKKVAGLKFIVVGQYALKGDRRTDLARYEEIFYLRHENRATALYLIRRFMIEPRLEKKHEQFRFVRTCSVKSLPILAEDIGISKLRQKGVEAMDGEEIRSYIILSGYPLDIMDGIPVDLDIIERVQKYEAAPKEWGKKKKPGQTASEAEIDGPVGGSVTAIEEDWKDLDTEDK